MVNWQDNETKIGKAVAKVDSNVCSISKPLICIHYDIRQDIYLKYELLLMTNIKDCKR